MKNALLSMSIALAAAQAFASTHTVTFRKMNGTVLKTVEVAHGADATSLKPALPTETGMKAKGWDHADWLASVTNDVTCWALYEATSAKSPSTGIASASVVDRATPYSLDEYFQMYNNLAWSDEFSGSTLSASTSSSSDGKNWNYETGLNDGGLMKYTSTGGNHILSNGTLKLRAKRESFDGKSFTSGSIQSKGKVAFKYGRCEIRAKLTKQVGSWPAFWLMGTTSFWPFCGELDILEQVNGSDWISGNFHIAESIGKILQGGSMTVTNGALVSPEDGVHWGDGFHRIGVIVNDFELVWYVDDHIFKRMDVRNATRYKTIHDYSWFVMLNLSFGGDWTGISDPNDPKIANFQSEDYEIDYCRIYTNTTADNTVVREAEPDGVRLATPVKATVWRGWQMKWGMLGAYRSGLDRHETAFLTTAMKEYFGRDGADIVTFLTRPSDIAGATDKAVFDVPGVSTLSLSPDQGSFWTDEDGYSRDQLLNVVAFNKERFSTSKSAISSLPLSNDANYTNCCAVVADLVEKESGAKVKVVSVNVCQTNGIDFATLFSKLNQFKNDRTILLFQSMDSSYHSPLKSQASSKLDKTYKYLGEYKVWPAYQFAYATTNCVSATAANPAPLSVPKSNGKPSGVHTNQAYCATVQFETAASPEPSDPPQPTYTFAKSVDVSFTGYSGEALTDFPVLVRLSENIPGFSYSDFKAQNGGDLRFFDAAGNLLSHEIDTWNPNGVSTAWVKVPTLDAKTAITAKYSCTSGTPPTVNAKDVWDDDFVGVWHLGAAAGVSAQPDSTANGKGFGIHTNNSDGVASGADGVVGRSASTGIRADGKGCFFQSDADKLFVNQSAFTVETWTWQDDHEPDQNPTLRYVLAHSGQNETSYDWRIYENNKGKLVMQFYSLGSLGESDAKIFADDGAARPARAQWNHTAFAWDGSIGQVGLYLGGAQLALAEAVTSKDWTGTMNGEKTGFNLGNHRYDNTKSFKGRIDEVRISKVARSAAWIKATHDTIANADFATYTVAGAEPPVVFAKEVGVAFTGYADAALANFPVLVRLSTAIPGFSYADFQIENGGDLRFFDSDGNLLAHEIDTWNLSGVSTVWVKVPTLNASTAITAKYGCANPPAVNAKDVWDENYVGVWHLGEAALPLAESTGVSTPFASKTGTASYGAMGAVGGSVDFAAAKGTESFLTAADDDDLDGFNDFTVEMWTCQDAFYNANEAYAGILVKRNARADNESWFTYQDKATLKPGLAYGNDAAASDRTLALANTRPAIGEWTHQAFVRTVSTSKVVAFMDGTNNSTTVKSSGAVFAGSAPLMLGGGGGQKSFPGRIDEVRISKVARSAAWIKATHDTIANADFATYTGPDGVMLSGFAAWASEKGLTGEAAAFDRETNGIKNGIRYAFDIALAKGPSEIGTPIIQVVRDANGNPVVSARDLAEGRSDVTFGILATENLNNWQDASIIQMEKFSDGYWKPTASKTSGYAYPAKMFFKYKIEVK